MGVDGAPVIEIGDFGVKVSHKFGAAGFAAIGMRLEPVNDHRGDFLSIGAVCSNGPPRPASKPPAGEQPAIQNAAGGLPRESGGRKIAMGRKADGGHDAVAVYHFLGPIRALKAQCGNTPLVALNPRDLPAGVKNNLNFTASGGMFGHYFTCGRADGACCVADTVTGGQFTHHPVDRGQFAQHRDIEFSRPQEAAPDDVDPRDIVIGKTGGHVGAGKRGLRLGQQAGNVQRDIAVAEYGDGSAELGRKIRAVRVAVPVTGNRAGAIDCPQTGPVNRQPPIPIEAGGQHHRVHCPAQRIQRQIAPDLQIAQQGDALAFEQSLKLPGDRFRALVVRRHAIAHQTVRRGQTIDHAELGLGQGLSQRLGRVASGRAGADDRDSCRHGSGLV